MGPARGLGGMRRRLELQQEVRTPDGGGGYTVNWSTVATVWAEVEPISGRERFEAMRLQGEVTHRIVVRHRRDLTPDHTWRLRLGSRSFNVRAVINQGERDRFLELLCQEGVAT